MHQPTVLPPPTMAQSGPLSGFGSDEIVRAEEAAMVFLLVCAALTGTLMVVVLTTRQRDQHARDGARVVYRLAFPRDLTVDQVVAFVRSLAFMRAPRWSVLGRPSAVFELV